MNSDQIRILYIPLTGLAQCETQYAIYTLHQLVKIIHLPRTKNLTVELALVAQEVAAAAVLDLFPPNLLGDYQESVGGVRWRHLEGITIK